MEGEIDLRGYLKVIIRRWKWMVAITLVAVIAAAIASFFLIAPVYEARAGVLILRSRSEITFEPTYRTLTEEQLAYAGMEIASRREAIQALVESSPVAAEVIAKLGATLEPDEVTRLSEMVKTETRGDLIEIVVRSTSPKKATAIANAWAEAYEGYVNELYGGRPESPNDINAQVTETEAIYQEAEEALAQFLGRNQINALQSEIEAKQELIASYKEAQTTVQAQVFNQQLDTKWQILADYYADLVQLEQLLADARALQRQLEGEVASRSAATGDALAVIFLRTQAFASSANLPVELQISLGEGGDEAAPQGEDVQALIAILETRQEETQAHIDELSSQLLASKEYELTASPDDPLSRLINQCLEELLQLEEQLEREDARKRELTQARDLTWEMYQTLARKEAEVEISALLTDTEVHFAIHALEPESPVAPKKKQNIAMAGVLGLMVSVLAAFGAEYLGSQEGETSSG